MLHKDVLISLCQARDMLRDTGDGTLSVQDVAREVGMSQFHFIRLFKAVFGETPKQCQLRARLERAKHLLMLSESSRTGVCVVGGGLPRPREARRGRGCAARASPRKVPPGFFPPGGGPGEELLGDLAGR